MMVSYGARIVGAYKPLSQQTLQLDASVPGQIYEVTIKTTGISDQEEVIALFLQELPQKEPTAKIVWMHVDDVYVHLQIEGSPFFWVSFVAFLPQILALLGIGVAGIAVWNVITNIPGWIWGLMVFGVGLIVLGPTISGLFEG